MSNNNVDRRVLVDSMAGNSRRLSQRAADTGSGWDAFEVWRSRIRDARAKLATGRQR
jgi:hypothetical protein